MKYVDVAKSGCSLIKFRTAISLKFKQSVPKSCIIFETLQQFWI